MSLGRAQAVGTGGDWGDGVLARLTTARLTARGFLTNASNHTLLVQVGDPGDGVHAVYKPRAGERPLWDFPSGTLCQRETAAYLVSAFLGWGVVPPTVLRDGPMGPGSVQLFVPHDPRRHYFVLVDDETHHRELARIATFDLLINNADRKASHVMLGDDGRIRGCDHGLTFHPQPKLRTVIWELAGTPLAPEWRADLARLDAAVDSPAHELTRALRQLLSSREVAALRRRAARLCTAQALPVVDGPLRAYPWPPL
ncbi:MAG: SCO1664 family protein [Actinomycetota bacterium]|nr:SCO1664 family protein [Actinomycetota bacterium]